MNGNLKSLTYRGNTIPLVHGPGDRIERFGDGAYAYDHAGRVVQNAKEEFFTYNSLGQLRRVWKRGRFDVEYFYDSEGRLSGRKDNHGNITQFLYGDPRTPSLLTHIYSPRENRVHHLLYDQWGRLVYFQVNRAEKFYVGSDQSGTPLLVFNQYGRIVKEVTRSPFGHIVYDSDPLFYLPIDFRAGILDKVTLLVHMQDKRVYDPLIGHFLTPDWESILDGLDSPYKFHLYRLKDNDPINHEIPTPPLGQRSWLQNLGYKIESMAPQLFPEDLSLQANRKTLVVSGLETRIMEKAFDESLLRTIPQSVVSKLTLIPSPAALISQIEPPLGKNILLSRTLDGKAMISCPFCTTNKIYRDVFTQILNGSDFVSFVSHSSSQDVFHFAKKELWKASDDLAELKRLSGQVNVTVHDRSAESQVMMDLKIQMSGAALFLKYGLSGSREETRLINHAKSTAVRKAWGNLKELIRANHPVLDLSSSERDEILKNGHINSHHPEFTHNPEEIPAFADDPANVRFVKKSKSSGRRQSGVLNHQ